VLKRRDKTWSEVMLLLLSLSAAVWYSGNAVDRLAHLLVTGRLPYVVIVTDVICCLGIALVPSLLMVMALLYLNERRRLLPFWLQGILVAAICALVLPFSLVFVNIVSGEQRLVTISASPVGHIFLGWLALSLISSAWVCFRQTQEVTDKKEGRFFQMLFWSTVALAALLLPAPFLMATVGPAAGPTGETDLIISLWGLFPGVMFAYYVYRYNYLEFILRRTIFHGFLTLLVISIYYFLILEFARWVGHAVPRLNVALVEALLVIGLVYLFPRMGAVLRDLLRLVAFRRTADAEYRLSTVNREISLDPMLDPARLLNGVCRETKEVCVARNVSIVLAADSRLEIYGDVPQEGFDWNDLEDILRVCSESGSAWLTRPEISDVRGLAAMRKLEAHTICPVLYEGAYRGLIAVGRTPVMLPLTEEVADQLVVMANRISSAMGRAKMIREKLQLQRRLYEKEKFTSLGQLAASVAHEVRNPLSSIKSLVQCLAEDLERKGMQAEETGLIVDEINRLNRTVTGLLRYARPAEEGRQETDFKEVLDVVLRLLRHELERRRTALQLSVPDGLPLVRAGEDEMKEMIFNLVFNALEAMPAGGTLTVQTEQSDNRLRVAVSDTGHGIPEELIEKVFEPSFTTKPGGTGLGLSIVRERLQQIGGTIRCRSSEAGTTMELDLPLATRRPESQRPEA
jgi:signal transduction histidine kinase